MSEFNQLQHENATSPMSLLLKEQNTARDTFIKYAPELKRISWYYIGTNVWKQVTLMYDGIPAFPPPIVADFTQNYPMLYSNDGGLSSATLAQFNYITEHLDTRSKIGTYFPVMYECRVYSRAVTDEIRRIWNMKLPWDCAIMYAAHLLSHEFMHYLKMYSTIMDAINKVTSWEDAYKKTYDKKESRDAIIADEKDTEKHAMELFYAIIVSGTLAEEIATHNQLQIIPGGAYDKFLRSKYNTYRNCMSMYDYMECRYRLNFEDHTQEEIDAIKQRQSKIVKWQKKLAIKDNTPFIFID